MDTGSLQIAAGTLQGAQTVGSFVSGQRAAGAIVAQSDFDTKLAALQSLDALQRGSEAANRARVATGAEVGSARARLAASGVQVSGGSAAGIQAQDATFGALDEQMIRNSAAREAMGYTTQATLSALGARQHAQAVSDQSYATLLTGAAKTYGLFPKSTVKLPAGAYAGDSGGDGQDGV